MSVHIVICNFSNCCSASCLERSNTGVQSLQGPHTTLKYCSFVCPLSNEIGATRSIKAKKFVLNEKSSREA